MMQQNAKKEAIYKLIGSISKKIQELYLRYPSYFERVKIQKIQEKFLDLTSPSNRYKPNQAYLEQSLKQLYQELLNLERSVNKRDFFMFFIH